MPNPAVFRLQVGELSLEGRSRAGEETWFRVRPPGVGFDVGRGPHGLVGIGRIFLSHGHLDHASGLPWLLSQRSMQKLGPTRIGCPAAIVEPLRALVGAAEALENCSYDYTLEPLEPGDRVPLDADFELQAFATDHVVPSLGFHLIRRKERLAERLRGLDQGRIAELARAGEAVGETAEEHWLTYCGDTGPGVLSTEPRLFEARVLVIECTFFGETMRESSALFGHLHLDDLAERQDAFRNDAIVLHHLSRRHRLADLRRQVHDRLPELAERIHLPGEETR